MEINAEQLRDIIKQSVKEALQEFYQNKEAPTSKESTESKAQEPDTSGQNTASDGLPTYEDLFHRIMAQVARGSIDEKTAGQLLSEAYQTFGNPDKAPPPKHEKPPLEEEPYQSGDSKTHEILMRIAGWEKELSNLTGEAAESTLEMMERMRSKIVQETAKVKQQKDEADMYKASQEIEKEEQERRTAEKIKSMKEKLSSDKNNK